MGWRVVILLGVGAANLATLAHLMWGSTGFLEYRELQRQLKDAQLRVEELDRRNMELSNEIRWLQSDSSYVEKMIRQRLHYVRDNEILYLFGEHSPTSRAERDDRKN